MRFYVSSDNIDFREVKLEIYVKGDRWGLWFNGRTVAIVGVRFKSPHYMVVSVECPETMCYYEDTLRYDGGNVMTQVIRHTGFRTGEWRYTVCRGERMGFRGE